MGLKLIAGARGDCSLKTRQSETSPNAIDLGSVPRLSLSAKTGRVLLRKEVIQPQVLLQLPCYDFTPIMNHTVGTCLPYGLA